MDLLHAPHFHVQKNSPANVVSFKDTECSNLKSVQNLSMSIYTINICSMDEMNNRNNSGMSWQSDQPENTSRPETACQQTEMFDQLKKGSEGGHIIIDCKVCILFVIKLVVSACSSF